MENELQNSGQLHGYRWFHLRCLQNNLVVTQEIVRELIKYLDPTGVEFRKRKRLRRRQYFNKGPKLYVAFGFVRQTKTLWDMYKWLH